MHKRIIATSASNKFFPSVLNLIGSIKKNYPDHPPIIVWGIDLNPLFKKLVREIPGVTLKDIPHFASFWRACYTWKPYIFANTEAEQVLYLDAGNIIHASLDSYFNEIASQGYVAFGQEVKLEMVTPDSYARLFSLSDAVMKSEVITAGIFGFNKNHSEIKKCVDLTYASAEAGFCVGWSKVDQWRNKGFNKTNIIRDCDLFRHDTTMLSVFFYTNIPAPHIHNVSECLPRAASAVTPNAIENIRLFDYDFIYIPEIYPNNNTSKLLCVSYISLFRALKRANHIFKNRINK